MTVEYFLNMVILWLAIGSTFLLPENLNPFLPVE